MTRRWLFVVVVCRQKWPFQCVFGLYRQGIMKLYFCRRGVVCWVGHFFLSIGREAWASGHCCWQAPAQKPFRPNLFGVCLIFGVLVLNYWRARQCALRAMMWKIYIVKREREREIYCFVPRCPATFWTHPEIIPVGQFFRRWIQSINPA